MRGRSHGGDHKTYDKFGKTQSQWLQTPSGVKCREPNGNYICTLSNGHTSRHEAWGSNNRLFLSWPNRTLPNYSHVVDEEVAAIKKQTTVLLTLEDLKTIAYYMAEEEDGDKTKIKIDKALKGML
jgi:hypothetical protein